VEESDRRPLRHFRRKNVFGEKNSEIACESSSRDLPGFSLQASRLPAFTVSKALRCASLAIQRQKPFAVCHQTIGSNHEEKHRDNQKSRRKRTVKAQDHADHRALSQSRDNRPAGMPPARKIVESISGRRIFGSPRLPFQRIVFQRTA